MTWYAVSAIDDALEATKRFLFPFSWWRWLKLAIVVFFLGGAGGSLNVPSGTGNVDLPSDEGPGTGSNGGAGTGTGAGLGQPGAGDVAVPGGGPELGGLGDAELAVIIGLVAVVLLVALVFAVVGAVMEFVLLDALRTNDVRLRRYFRTRFGKGVRLFGFRLGVGLLLVLVIGALVVGGIMLTDNGAGPGLGAILGALVVAVPLFVVLTAIGAVTLGLTTEFVAPVMIVEDLGVFAGWRRFWPILTAHWKQYGLYLVLRLILSIAVGIAAAIATAIAVVALLISFGIVGAIAAVALGGFEALVSSIVGIAIVAVLGVVFVVSAIAVVLVVRILVVTYFRCYALSVLGDIEPAFDLLGRLRDGNRDSDGDPTPASG